MSINSAIEEREEIQLNLLAAIYERAHPGEVVLKGGMAMRAVMGSSRMTKHIDLAQDPELDSGRLRSLIRSAIKAVLSSGILVNHKVTEPKQTHTVARWKIGGQCYGRN